jgi:hypothetical protein
VFISFAVTLSIKDGESICPFHPITLRCVVNTTLSNRTTPFLSWKCAKDSGENVVFCGPILNFDCSFGTVANVTGSCECNDALIVSEATFTAKSTDARTLICSDGTREEKVSLIAQALHTPVLSYIEIPGDNKIRNVTIKWTTPDGTKNDIEYHLSVKNSTHTTTWTTNISHVNQSLTVGTRYTATAYSQRCDGTVKSNVSDPLDIFKEDPTSINPRQTSSAIEPKESESGVGGVAGGTVAAAVFAIAAIVVLIILVYFIRRYLMNNKLVVDGVKDYPGEQLSQDEKSSIMRVNEDKSRKKSGVGGLCIDGNKTYYSCCEKYKTKPEELYTLHVLKPDGELILGGFKHIRGIDKDSNNCCYVVDSSHKRVLKFDSNWNPLRRTSRNSTDYGTVLSEPFGILATQEYVFVCAYRNKQICIFDHELSLRYRITHNYLLSGPTDIAVFREIFFVTIKSSIIVFQIDFDSKTYKAIKMDSFVTNRKTENFKQALELRGICASKQYLYVAESSGRLLCLEYDFENSQLVYVDSIQKCCPVVVVHNAGTIYYSRRTIEGKFTIASVHHDSATNKMETKDFLTI